MDRVQIKRLETRLSNMTLDQRKALYGSLRKAIPPPRLSKYCPKIIAPKQEAFLSARQTEVLYGGAAGGMKTSSLLIGALQYADIPQYSGLLLRRVHRELDKKGSFIELSKRWLSGTDARWREQKSRWEFPSGAYLEMGYLDRDDDKWQYGTAYYNYIGIDEAAEFPNEETYEFLFSRLRRDIGNTVPGKVRLGANPLGPGATWLKKRFFVSKDPDRLYIPAKLDDNPFIDKEDYRKSLAKLPTYLRQALEDGDWDAKPPGKMFERGWFRKTAREYPHNPIMRVRFWDLAATQEDKKKNPSWTCGVRMSYDNGLFYVEDVKRARETPGKVKELVKQTAQIDGYDTDIIIEQEPGSSGIAVTDDYIRSLPRHIVRALRPSGPKETRATPYASQCEAGNVVLIEGEWNEAYIDEHEQFPSERTKNDQVDASSGAYNEIAKEVENDDRLSSSDLYAGGDLPTPDW